VWNCELRIAASPPAEVVGCSNRSDLDHACHEHLRHSKASYEHLLPRHWRLSPWSCALCWLIIFCYSQARRLRRQSAPQIQGTRGCHCHPRRMSAGSADNALAPQEWCVLGGSLIFTWPAGAAAPKIARSAVLDAAGLHANLPRTLDAAQPGPCWCTLLRTCEAVGDHTVLLKWALQPHERRDGHGGGLPSARGLPLSDICSLVEHVPLCWMLRAIALCPSPSEDLLPGESGRVAESCRIEAEPCLVLELLVGGDEPGNPVDPGNPHRDGVRWGLLRLTTVLSRHYLVLHGLNLCLRLLTTPCTLPGLLPVSAVLNSH